MKLKLVSILHPINGKSNKSVVQITFAYLGIKTDKVSIAEEWCSKTKSVNISV